MYGEKQYKNHASSPAMSFYVLDDDTADSMEKLSCVWCKRTILDIKGHIDVIITTPMPSDDFGIAINIRCKLCGQNYRLLINAKHIQG
jgi:hypothetical protein